MPERDVVERFEIVDHGCVYIAKARQAWRLGTADLDVVYDKEWRPLRAWKRTTLPVAQTANGNMDIRRYEMRAEPVEIKRLKATGERVFEQLRGGRPTAVVTPGRGLLTAWIRKARLRVGGIERGLALDIREPLESIEPVALRRERDRYEPTMGRRVRVYTVFGRESVFADDTDTVIGDLRGLRLASEVRAPRPPPFPDYGVPDPVGTP